MLAQIKYHIDRLHTLWRHRGTPQAITRLRNKDIKRIYRAGKRVAINNQSRAYSDMHFTLEEAINAEMEMLQQ